MSDETITCPNCVGADLQKSILAQMRNGQPALSILDSAAEALGKVLHCDRCVVWQVIGDQLVATSEYVASGEKIFKDTGLGSQESTTVVLEFLSRFPDETGAGVINIPDTSQESHLQKISPTLAGLIEKADARSRLMVQLRSRGIFCGFMEVQQCEKARAWSPQDAITLHDVGEVLSIVVQQYLDVTRLEEDARQLKLFFEIGNLFREPGGKSEESLKKSIKLVSSHMSFVHCQLYLKKPEEDLLVAQIEEGDASPLHLSDKENPFVEVFQSSKSKIFNVDYSKKDHHLFGAETALVLPLISEGNRLGVFGLWKRASRTQFRPQDREFGLSVATMLAQLVCGKMIL